MRAYKVRIRVVSPVHVGTGEVFEPTSFFVNEKEGYLGEIDFEKFWGYISNEDMIKFKELCREGNLRSLIKLYDFVDSLCTRLLEKGIEDFVLRKIDLCQGLLTHYKRVKSLVKKTKDLHREFNRFTISRTAFSPNDNHPILPGSSVKGSLRTALLNLKKNNASGSSGEDYKKGRGYDSKRLESEILNYDPRRINQDPLRLVKLSDFRPITGTRTRVVYAVNMRKDGERARGPYQILEVVEPGSVFEGEIVFGYPEEGSGIRVPVLREDVTGALEAFYSKEQEREEELLRRMDVDVPLFPGSGLPLRLGRHSGAECVTIEGFRRIMIRGRGGQKRFDDHATTIWLASEEYNPLSTTALRPFGWVEIDMFTEEEYRERFGDQDDRTTSVDLDDIAYKERGKDRGIGNEDSVTRMVDGGDRKLEGGNGLSEYEKVILKIRDQTTDDNTIMDYFRRIDQFEDKEQQEIALALKERWQKEGRWKVSKKRKQYKKVQRIKEILGES